MNYIICLFCYSSQWDIEIDMLKLFQKYELKKHAKKYNYFKFYLPTKWSEQVRDSEIIFVMKFFFYKNKRVIASFVIKIMIANIFESTNNYHKHHR